MADDENFYDIDNEIEKNAKTPRRKVAKEHKQ
jgi:hypothetical protein